MKLSRPRGFSLIEMLIVCSIFTLVTGVVAVLFTQGTYTYRHGETHLEMQRGGRALTQRIAPFLATMIDSAVPSLSPLRRNTNGSGGITLDQEMLLDTDYPEVYFLTTEDWLGPDYPSRTDSSTMALSTSDLGRFMYRIRYVDPSSTKMGDGEIFLERLVQSGTSDYTVEETRRLYNEKDEAVKNFRFVRVRSNLLQLRFDMENVTRSAQNQAQTTREEFRMTFNIPTQTL